MESTKELGKIFAQSSVQFDFHSCEGMKKLKNDETVYPSRGQEMYTVFISARWTDDKYDKEANKWLNQTEELFFKDKSKDRIRLISCSSPPEEELENISIPKLHMVKRY